MPNVIKDKALDILRALHARADGLTGSNTDDPDWEKWYNDVKAAARNIFGEESSQLAAVKAVHFSPQVLFSGMDDSVWRDSFRSGVVSTQQHIASMVTEIEQFWPDEQQSGQAVAPAALSNDGPVFIVHGHNLDLAQSVARFVERLGLTAVILHEEADKGRTIIEKFEQEAAPCSFAVVLATGDDEARGRGDGDLRPRARQNVILELGYFLGKLGRSRVALLYESDVEVPSDYSGVLYVGLDGEWKVKIAREMRAAGLPVNAEAVLSP